MLALGRTKAVLAIWISFTLTLLVEGSSLARLFLLGAGIAIGRAVVIELPVLGPRYLRFFVKDGDSVALIFLAVAAKNSLFHWYNWSTELKRVSDSLVHAPPR